MWYLIVSIPDLCTLTYFDSINHEYMFKCLRHFNFINDLVNWVKLLYKNAKSCVTNNGHHSDFFHIWRFVRQGCPLSPNLFIICIELLSNQVRKSPDIKGIYIEGKENKHLFLQMMHPLYWMDQPNLLKT